MNIEKIEVAFGLLIENIESLQAELSTDFYDAFVEQNAIYLGAMTSNEAVKANNDKLREAGLSPLEWQKLFQYVLLKGSQLAPMQANHALTPDSIGLIFNFMIESLMKKSDIRIIEFGSGTGNLAETLLVNLQKTVDYLGFEIDDLLLDLAASMSEIIGTKADFMQLDAVQPQVLEKADVVISDLPLGYYPDQTTASHFTVGNPDGPTYAQHLLMEQSFKYLKDKGLGIYLAPENLLNSEQAPLLKAWLKKQARVVAVITLPSSLFKGESKAIYLLEKGQSDQPTFVYPLGSLTEPESLKAFMAEFSKQVKL
ncbi:class I SAM-dependent methyltransferase [Lactococcus termiticola]|uniref:Adenine-specific DNA methylase n=1 Tax=Lactococcus termiticola TaxID=2169526 RepID=A0A2R5HHC9_9LACT|nr:class I SAM-dependent methyltransferase [Lactococcus termiticola]GBG97449.1 adenine-specific DNA methylase [Lactococcus termiticola]